MGGFSQRINLPPGPKPSKVGADASILLVTLGLLGHLRGAWYQQRKLELLLPAGASPWPKVGRPRMEGFRYAVLAEGDSCPSWVMTLLSEQRNQFHNHQLLQRPLAIKWVVFYLNRTAPVSVISIKAAGLQLTLFFPCVAQCN